MYFYFILLKFIAITVERIKLKTHCKTQAVRIYNEKGLNEIFLAESVRFGAVVFYNLLSGMEFHQLK